jgi:dihydrodipicolinate synthase/N-acetylneuraminate lyase
MMNWTGVMPAVTTCFDESYQVDHDFMLRHCRWLLDNGCSSLVLLGSLGEGATLSFEEKVEVLRTGVSAAQGRAPVVASISALSTAEAVNLAKTAADAGCDALMILPPFVYQGSWREMKAHVTAVLAATPLACMLYNNPVAYGTDFLPNQVQELTEYSNLQAVKESSADARRVSDIRYLVGDRLQICAGIDDMILASLAGGAGGWIAGLANALPRESVDLFNAIVNNRRREADALYRWFLPLLRMDAVPAFVQLIKLVQSEVGMGNMRVRPPRLELSDTDRMDAQKLVRDTLRNRPQPESVSMNAFAG